MAHPTSTDPRTGVQCPMQFLYKQPFPGLKLSNNPNANHMPQGDLFTAWRLDVDAIERESLPNQESFLTKFLKTLRKNGMRAAWKAYRWKFVALVFTYYLIRDLFLYVFIPIILIKFF